MENSLIEARFKAAAASGGASDDAIYALILRLIKAHNLRGDLLDYGAGRGLLTERLTRSGYEGQITGVDIFPRPRQLAPNVCWLEADLNGHIDVADESFDVVLAAEIIEHLENPRQSFRELYRMLRVGGALLMTTPNQESIRSLVSLILKGHFVAFLDTGYPAHITALVRKDLRRLCTETSFGEPNFYYTDSGSVPKIPKILWQTLSMGLLRGRFFSDNIAMVTSKSAHEHKRKRSG
jgi:2-polyprenyl-3-methyl-5-hydroxy-6-metoxy-1,4-benzoquinol methylase